MNLCDCYVTRVLSNPIYTESFGLSWWSVEVEYNSWGALAYHTLVFKTKEDAEKVREGFHFLA